MKTTQAEKRDTGKAVIFVAEGFDEEFVIRFFCEERRKGHDVQIVGAHARKIFGQHGLNLPPHVTLSEFIQEPPGTIRALCIPGNMGCAATLLTDPRILRFIQTHEKEQRRYALAAPAFQILDEMGIYFSNEAL